MKRILLLGLDPETVDYSDPALPPGMTVEKVPSDRGWDSDVSFIHSDETAGPTLERLLYAANCDCVVTKAAPNSAIAFNTRPDDSADAAPRQVLR